MNKIFSLFVMGTLMISNLEAQELKAEAQNEVLIKADTVQVSYESKLRPALEYTSEVDVKGIKKQWKGFLMRNYNISSKSKGVFMTSEDVVISSLSDKRMNLYASVMENGAGSKVKFFGAFGYDIYIDSKSYQTEFSNMKKIVENFIYESTTVFYNEKTNVLSKKIAVLTDKNASLLKEIQKNSANIKLGKQKVETLSEVEDDGSKASLKAKKKIIKIQKKEVSAITENEENKKEITANEEKIELLKKEVAVFTNKKELLKR